MTTKLFCGYCGAYLCGESGTSQTGNVHHYYKCVSVKKKRTECHKKSVRKEWIEDLVVSETMRMVMDDRGDRGHRVYADELAGQRECQSAAL